MICPKCETESSATIVGIEIPEVYDGVSFWLCRYCGSYWSRWTGELIPNWANLTWAKRAKLGIEQRRRRK